MTKRIAINGFGRIGRTVFRILHERAKKGQTDIAVHCVNDLTDVDTLAYLLKYDSVHGRFDGKVEGKEGAIWVDGKSVDVTSEKDPTKLPWKAYEVDVVLESTGFFLGRDQAAKHLEAGAKKVLISAPHKGQLPDATICYGVNTQTFKPAMSVISSASCTTNCIAPVAKVLHTAFGIEKAMVTTIHSYTNDQSLLDMPHKDKRRARAAAVSMIPTTTGAAQAVSMVLPELQGKFEGMAIRVPTPNVSCIDLVAMVSKKTTAKEVNERLREASEGEFRGIMGYCIDPVVSIDMNGTNESSIVDSLSTSVLDGNMVKVVAWYDNEWGFGNRAADLLQMLAKAC